MAVSSISATSTSSVQDRPTAPPKEITKSGLEEMRSRAAASGRDVPEGLDTLIEKFDDAAGSSGKMTFAQFKAFAADNGVTVPDAPQGGARSGGPGGGANGVGKPPSGGAPAGKSSSSGSSNSTTSASDVANASDEELRTLAAKGNQQAKQEIAKREARRADNDGTGTQVDAWA